MLDNLPKVSQQSSEFMGLTELSDQISKKLFNLLKPMSEELSRITNQACKLSFLDFKLTDKANFFGKLFPASWPPYTGNAWLELEPKSIQTAVYKSIGQEISKEDQDPKLSDLEQGVALFLFARIFEAAKESFQITDNPELPNRPLICLNLALKLGDTNSYVRVWVSKELLESLKNANLPKDSEELIAERTKQRTENALVPIKFELSKLMLSEAELKNLEKGDIILLESSEFELKENKLKGRAKALIGEPEFGVLEGDFGASEQEQITLKINNIEISKEPL